MSASPPPKLWAVMPAAGSGSRLAAERPKQYLSLGGKTLLEHSIQRLLASADCAAIVVALAADDRYFRELPPASLPTVRSVIGGADRAASVKAALLSLQDRASDEDWVLVHDAARPCVPVADIKKLLRLGCADAVGAILATPVVDTLKRGDAQQRIVDSPNRQQLWRALTPQLFRFGELLAALQRCAAEGVAVTDEASAMEYCGKRGLLVEGDPCNIKITFAADLRLAAFYLAEQTP